MGKAKRKRQAKAKQVRKVKLTLRIGQDPNTVVEMTADIEGSASTSAGAGPPAEPPPPTLPVTSPPATTTPTPPSPPPPAVAGPSRRLVPVITADTPRYWNYGQTMAREYARTTGGCARSKFDPERPSNGIEILCELPEKKTPIEVRGVVPPGVFGELAYVVRFRHDVTGQLSSAYVHHQTFKENHPQLLIQCYEKHTVFSVDNRTTDELAAAFKKAKLTEAPKEDSSDSEDEDKKMADRVPLLMSDSSETETESESDVYEKEDLQAYLAKYK